MEVLNQQTYGSIRAVPSSSKHRVIHLLDQLILHKDYLAGMQDIFFDTVEEYNYALCYGIAKVLSRSYHINAVATGWYGRPREEFLAELQPMFEAICAEQRLQGSLLDTAGTLDIEVGLRIGGFHLYADVLTFPRPPF